MGPTNRPEQTLLVTGGCGYLGSRLIRDLASDERLGRPRVRILDNFQSGRHEALLDLPASGDFEFIEGDLLDRSVLRLALSGVDRVVHLAAVVRSPFSFENPSWLEQVNHWGTAHLVEACLEAGTPHLLFASSCAVYGPGGPFDERAVCRPMGPYAQSKRGAEDTLRAAAERGLAATIIRLAILYGSAPAMRFDTAANRLAYLAGVGRSLTIYGDGEQRRPLIHVADASSAIRFLLAAPPPAGADLFNAVGHNVSVLEIAAAIQAAKPGVPLRFTEQDVRTHLSITVDASALMHGGWSPGVGLGEGLAELVGRFRRLGAAGLLAHQPAGPC